MPHSEQKTRQRIDEQLRAADWQADTVNLRYSNGVRPEHGKNMAIAEVPFGEGYADYALFVGLQLIGIVEAKKNTKDVMSDVSQAERYAQAGTVLENVQYSGAWNTYRVPFVYAANGRDYVPQLEIKSGIWFRDVRLPTNHGRAVQEFHSPETLLAMLEHNEQAAYQRLHAEPFDYLSDTKGLGLREYQVRDIQAIERTLEQGHRSALLAMATGTGKTRLAIGLCYRLIKSKRFRRILFLVDRSLLGTQAMDRFNDVRLEDFQTFGNIYHVADLEAKTPDDDTKLHFATVQGLVRRLFSPESGESTPLVRPLSIDAYDCIIVDEAHRGYTLDKEVADDEAYFRTSDDYTSQYRRVLEYFDAVRIGLTATPALHTAQIFGHPVFHYSYRQAVVDGVLIDHEPPYNILTELNSAGIKWERGENVEAFQQTTGEVVELGALPDELTIEVDGFNKRVITENFNRTVCKELVKYLDPDDKQKTLIFCANDAHADLVVKLLKEEFLLAGIATDNRAIKKITGSVDDPQGETRLFTNERYPTIVATVDLLSTGVDVPSICNIVFLRRVKSRILYEQMLGRATRLCPDIGKTHFRVFDAVQLYQAMADVTDMKPVTSNTSKTFATLLAELGRIAEDDTSGKKAVAEEIAAKFHRVKRNLTPESRQAFEKAYGQTPEAFFTELTTKGENGCSPQEMATRLLKVASHLTSFDDRLYADGLTMISYHQDSVREVTRGYGAKNTEKPEDYIEHFKKFLADNINAVPALAIVCQRPTELTRETLRELHIALGDAGFSANAIQTAWNEAKNNEAKNNEATSNKARNNAGKGTNDEIVEDIIAYIRTLALGEPLQSYADRVQRAVQSIKSEKQWNAVQLKWLDRIAQQMQTQLTLTRESFDREPFKAEGGFTRLNSIFTNELEVVINRIHDTMFKQAS